MKNKWFLPAYFSAATMSAVTLAARRLPKLAYIVPAFGMLLSADALIGVCGSGYTSNTCTTLAATTGSSTDGNFTILAGSPESPVTAFTPFVTNSSALATGWLADGIDASSWISPTGSENPGDPPGIYTYEESFTIGAGFDPSTAQIVGAWATDNSGVIMLNGHLVGTASLDFSALTSFMINSFFTVGLNKLDFVVTNGTITSEPVNPSGLRVEITSTAIAGSTPEPASFGLLGLGLAAIVLLGRRLRS